MSFVHKEQLSPSSLYQIGPLFSILVVHPSLGCGVGEGGGGASSSGRFFPLYDSVNVYQRKSAYES